MKKINDRRICILSSAHPAQDVRVFHKQAKSLAKAGYDVTLMALHEKNEVNDGVKIIAQKQPRNRFERFFFTTFKLFVKSLGQRADVYHFHDPDLIPIGMLLKILGKKVIYDVHEDYGKSTLTRHYLPKHARRFASAVIDAVEKLSSGFFDSVISATKSISDKFAHTKNPVTVNNYPVISKFAKGKREESPKTDFSIIYTGMLTEERGISEIVGAMEYLPDSSNIKLILCGQFVPEGYEKEVKGLKGFQRVEYLGWIEQEEVWSKLMTTAASIICFRPFPNAIHSQPNKMFDYMAAGLPIIASGFPLWKEIIEGNNCGLTVNPLDPEEIAEAIKYLNEHRDEARRMGENGRGAVMDKYNWRNEEKKLLKIYADLFKE